MTRLFELGWITITRAEDECKDDACAECRISSTRKRFLRRRIFPYALRPRVTRRERVESFRLRSRFEESSDQSDRKRTRIRDERKVDRSRETKSRNKHVGFDEACYDKVVLEFLGRCVV